MQRKERGRGCGHTSFYQPPRGGGGRVTSTFEKKKSQSLSKIQSVTPTPPGGGQLKTKPLFFKPKWLENPQKFFAGSNFVPPLKPVSHFPKNQSVTPPGGTVSKKRYGCGGVEDVNGQWIETGGGGDGGWRMGSALTEGGEYKRNKFI